MYAHTSDFTNNVLVKNHFFHSEADNPKYIDEKTSPPSKVDAGNNQRFTNTKIATYLYLTVYLSNIDSNKENISRNICRVLDLIEKSGNNIHEFSGLIQAIDKIGIQLPRQFLQLQLSRISNSNSFFTTKHSSSSSTSSTSSSFTSSVSDTITENDCFKNLCENTYPNYDNN